MGINVSCDYGGSELDTITYTIVAEEISRGRIIVKINMSTHNILYLYPIDDFSNNEQKERRITPFATCTKEDNGMNIGCFDLSEPGHKSNTGTMSTTVKLSNDGKNEV